MVARYLRYLILGLRILWPARAERRYARAIRASGLFDRGWYLASYPRMPRICRMMPERHYVLVGEAAGLCPSPGFSPRAYLHLNPGLAAAGVAPFAHYIAEGRAAGRAALDRPAGDAAPALPAVDLPPPSAPFAVVLHLYYREMWDGLAERLARQRFPFDLIVTLTARPEEDDTAIRARILARFPLARILAFPNHGRDILPFLHLARSGGLAPYRAVCKLHTKASPHRPDGAAWREDLLDGILGDPARMAARLAVFAADPAAGLWVADGHVCRGPAWVGPNGARLADLAARAGLPGGTADLAFAAGSIFWLSAALVARLAALPFGAPDFEPEMGQVDGTTAHALERLAGRVAQAAGLTLREAATLDIPPPPG